MQSETDFFNFKPRKPELAHRLAGRCTYQSLSFQYHGTSRLFRSLFSADISPKLVHAATSSKSLTDQHH